MKTKPFVFLDDKNDPYLVFRDWLHYWNHGPKNWVTLRKLKASELETMEARKLPKKEAALYGWPCDTDEK